MCIHSPHARMSASCLYLYLYIITELIFTRFLQLPVLKLLLLGKYFRITLHYVWVLTYYVLFIVSTRLSNSACPRLHGQHSLPQL